MMKRMTLAGVTAALYSLGAQMALAATALIGSPLAILPTTRSGTSKATVTDDMSATVAIAVCEV